VVLLKIFYSDIRFLLVRYSIKLLFDFQLKISIPVHTNVINS